MCYGKNTHKKPVTQPVAPKPVPAVRPEPVKVTQPRFEADVPKILHTNLSEQGTVYQPNPEIVPLAQVGDLVPADVFYSMRKVDPITPLAGSERFDYNGNGLNNNAYYNDVNNVNLVNNQRSEFGNAPMRSDIDRNNPNNVQSNYRNPNSNTFANNVRSDINAVKSDFNNKQNNIYSNQDSLKNMYQDKPSKFAPVNNVNNGLKSETLNNNFNTRVDSYTNKIQNDSSPLRAKNQLDYIANDANNAKYDLDRKVSNNIDSVKREVDAKRSTYNERPVYA